MSNHPRAIAGFSRGFTLVEMLVVVACLAIAALLVVPMTTNTSSERLRAAGQQLAADLQYAQMLSMGNSQRRCVVVFTPASHRYHLATHLDAASPLKHPTDQQSYIMTFGQGRLSHLAGVTLGSLSVGGDNQLGFTSLGALDQGTAASIELRLGSDSMSLTLNPDTGDVSAN